MIFSEQAVYTELKDGSAARISQDNCTDSATQDSPSRSSNLRQQVFANLATSEFLSKIPRDFARSHLVLSQGRFDGVEHLVAAESSNPAAVFNVGVRLGVQIEVITVESEPLARAIDEAYGQAHNQEGFSGAFESEASGGGGEIDRLLALADRDLLSTQGKGPIVKLVDAILFEALGRGASDVHFQPLADRTLIRYRLDGVLHTVREIPPPLTQPVISRIKVMGRMDIAERRVPQDGRATITIGERPIDLRISSLPTSYGERLVLRLLDNTNQLGDFATLGMPPEVSRVYLERVNRSNGIILLTGPTGSGKTTTLYATLRHLSETDEGLNIMTIEDPIEYELSSIRGHAGGAAISQAQVNARKGVTFATGLRHILRQDPDVIMVGEIRDVETAKIAVQSSLTGHLVFSTLHTNDAASAVTRLVDLGVEPYLVSASLSSVIAQRLVRRLHEDCGGEGCAECFNTGYRGRTGLFELLVVDEIIREIINQRGSLSEIRQHAIASGMRTLQEEGRRLVAEGLTNLHEVSRVVEDAQT